jgi:histidinol-phosphate/aromatic aminotransferase/cobyric acid decarboxylase-like protein
MSQKLDNEQCLDPGCAANAAADDPAEISKIIAMLASVIPARARVLDFGCNGERLDIALADLGYRVVAAAREADLFDLDPRLPGDEIDAAICLQPPGRHDAADVARLLQAVRVKLTNAGLLILADCGWQTKTDLGVLVRAAGFDVRRPAPPGWILATAAPSVPEALAFRIHYKEPPCELDLRWSPDEIDFVMPRPEQIWAALFKGGIEEVARDYALHDPWGGERGAAVLSSFFGTSIAPESVVFGAGATGLLRQLAPLVRAGRLLATRFVHRDFPLWAMAEGACVSWIDDERDDEALRATVAKLAPHVICLDRPSTLGVVIGLESLARICEQARRSRGFVIVDEAYHSYFAGADSAVSLTPTCDNLIVIRSLSKAYCAGGLRIGFAIGGAAAKRSLRRLVAPLQVSELAFQMGLRLLSAGDIFAFLRARIAAAKREMIAVLAAAGYSVARNDEELPWILISDGGGQIEQRLAGLGIGGKRLVPLAPTANAGFLRLAVPLSAERMQRFQQTLRVPS